MNSMDNIVLAIFYAYFLAFPLHVVHGSIVTPCSQTPYPQVCEHVLCSQNPKVCENFTNANLLSNLDQTGFTFLDLALKTTMEQAVDAHQLVSSMDLNSFNEQSKLAWNDCLELYKDTIDQLNRSMSSSNPLDANTWLSASIANHQTCQNGFIDFKLSSDLDFFPSMLSNFSKMLSNSLAIHKASTFVPTKEIHGRRLLSNVFPRWVSIADRKLLQSEQAPKGDIIVAQDGTGNYKTITEAVTQAAKLGGGNKRIVIYVKAGVYKENVDIKKTIKNLMFVGDGIDATIVTGGRSNEGGSTTFRSATFAVSGDGFMARDMTFENTAGPQDHQAVAFRSGSDHSVFYRCSFRGYQDTLYVYSQRQFYRDCDIYGTVDFIFGDAAVIFQNCNIYVRKPMSNQKNSVTAQGRTDPNENTGIIIHNSRILAAADLRPVQGSFETYLGRPWQKYSRTVIMKTTIDGLVSPAGWEPWSGSFALSTLYYGEYMNVGPGAGTGGRVKWPGFHVITSPVEASKFSVESFLAGGSWIPATGVPFVAGL
ncbi:hypothetical protein FEM48_Zijuj10G0121700 [Ziziphus jujuba var. spinosa]|uniref:Pectinesterase n=1 Tax=Ziziphus jujuba var. spinosa TaxID=714518 RepID=A0A978UNA9_ZIZJJ|nr:pectinesterase [Ziziphus jujuba var. spinosa]KAH7516311.1 hypothetical protein FEM48_Zijuj10G0121700 [Ziziphus jujuba var. spinosa]